MGAGQTGNRRHRGRIIALAAVALGLGLADRTAPRLAAEQPAGSTTFSGHIAGIVHRHCTPCHHEGQSAPFPFLSYEDVRKRARQVLEVVESRAMPPWLAEPGHGEFANERRLTEEERQRIRDWVTRGAPAGDLSAAPAAPRFHAGWQMGVPDLVVAMPRPYQLGPEGPDVYRNFVLPVPLDRNRWVRAVEFKPGNPRSVHHAFIRVDEEGHARKLDGQDGQPGFHKMLRTARMPGGQFLTWNPGRPPVVAPPGLAWGLRTNSDLVIELHLNRTGKSESVQPSIGIYFTDEPPTNTCYTFKLGSYNLDFPPGATNEIVHDSFKLPVDVELLAVYPHAHFLAREVQAHAVRPDGSIERLIWIKRWDFNWQGDYRYREPVRLPKGSVVHLWFTYDNSTNNPVNPHHPPQRVTYGEQSTDEMCELGLQVLTRTTDDLRTLEGAVEQHRIRQVEEWFRHRAESNPGDAEALTRYGMLLWTKNRKAEAWAHLQRAVELRPDLAEARYNKGVALRLGGRPAQASQELQAALRLDPRFPKAYQQLAFAFASLGQAADAERCFLKALEHDPADTVSRAGLTELRQFLQSQQSRPLPLAPAPKGQVSNAEF
ncbi:MAG TPA: hypothetical protein VNO52_10465 [Methylomirabilota bacterium]|nr:hypothetical protein [Methylomirabilota bacterium]